MFGSQASKRGMYSLMRGRNLPALEAGQVLGSV